MKIVVMSDSHGDKETVSAVSALSADAKFHCGDSELSAEDPLLSKMHIVRGNCDSDLRFQKSLIIEIGNKRILTVHGHEHDCKRTLLPLFYSAKEHEADIVLFGHSHLYGAELQDGILFVNPGSTLLPRAGKEPTFAEIEWDDVGGCKVSFKNMDFEIVDSVELINI
ncbi:metallophosphoesterase [Sporosarcina thermotolerans]|uniref:Phosphoesterase n=1 Tax=Sporosarcina thermotolerans TaxID=633404 RepID=A0AAW9AAF4_9BACL|nr:metallophosphoesterase [Sporosarcina thermotolerans]MDW0118132.1 metallophosphoesterase [Sporosarcina thermotolerans]WHT47625.1 metallophosphoesterase [Sporosarcina thermotolerans]